MTSDIKFRRLVKRLTPAPLLALRSHVLTRRMDKAFARLGSAEAFGKIYRDRVWGRGEDDFCSGLGSHDEDTVERYVAVVRQFLLGADSRLDVVDLGCGDFSVGSRLRSLCGRYVACDVVPQLIDRNRQKYAELGVDFRVVDATRDPLPPGDVCFVRQVLQHLSNEQILSIVPKLCQFEHLIVTEHLPRGPFRANLDKQMGPTTRITQFVPSGVVLSAAPFGLKAREVTTWLEADDSLSGTIVTTHYRAPHFP
jgi:SAM-dependent methyltransferase